MASGSWFDHLQSYYWIHNLVHLHEELSFWAIRRGEGGALTWMELSGETRQIQPYHFEIYYGVEERRDAYYHATMDQVQRNPRMIVGRLHGFCDLFAPLRGDESGQTFLHAGQFLAAPPTWKSLCDSWKQITGRDPTSGHPDFTRFVRMAVALPVLDDRVVAGLEELCDLLGQYLTGEDEPGTHHQEVDRVRREIFVDAWPNLDWIERAVSSERFRLTPWYHEGRLVDWMREEMKIERLPTTVMALMPARAPDEERDPLETLVQNTNLQRDLVRHAYAMPHTAAHALDDFGVYFVTSADSRKSPVAARSELRERASSLREFAARHGVRAVVGVGSSAAPGEPLATSHREAVHALHLCVQLEKDVLFHDERFESDSHDISFADVHAAAQALATALESASSEALRPAADRYVREVLLYSAERLDVARSHFLNVVFQLVASIKKRHALDPTAADQLGDQLARQLEEATSLSRLIEAFGEALGRLTSYASHTQDGSKSVRIESCLAYLRENFAEPLRLPDVAQRAGFSVPAFSRAFRQATGTSFLDYLRSIRVDHAKLLLRTTSLPAAQLAVTCGFQSAHHLIRSFKKVTGQTPGEYRAFRGADAAPLVAGE